MVGSARPLGESVLAGALIAAGSLSCQFPSYRVGESGTAGDAATAGGAAAIAGSASAMGGDSGVAGGMTGGGVAGQPDNVPEPVGMTLGPTTGKVVWGPSGPGDEFSDQCPVNQVLVGLEGTTGESQDVVRSVRGRCGEVSLAKSADGSSYETHITPSGVLAERGTTTTNLQVASCPTDQLVTGFSGRAGGMIDAIQIRCASLRVVSAAPRFELLVHGEANAGSIGGLGGLRFEVTECPADQVALGQYVRADGSPKAFGVLCATPSLVLK